MSRETHVTVIGAGIVGIAAALYLQRAHCRVTVIDRGAPGEGCSFGNAGLISPGACVPFSMPDMIWLVSLTSSTIREQRPYSSRPAGVSETLRVVRVRSFNPIAVSSRAI